MSEANEVERDVMCDDEKLAEILSKGGSIIMHKNDFERLKEYRDSEQLNPIFNSVKIYPDNLNLVSEGHPLAVLMDQDGINFDFRDSFNT